MAITFQMQDVNFRLEKRVRLKSWIRKVLRENARKEGSLSFVFTTDEKLHEVNLEFLSHDTYTDIITFDDTQGNVVSGDIMISIDRVKENADSYNVTFGEELHRVMIHGVLHLCGYKDKTDAEKQTMRRVEDAALRLLQQMP